MSSIGLGGLGRQTDRPKLIADYSKPFLKDLPTNFSHLSLHIFLQLLSAPSYKFPHLSLHIFLTSSTNHSPHFPTNFPKFCTRKTHVELYTYEL